VGHLGILLRLSTFLEFPPGCGRTPENPYRRTSENPQNANFVEFYKGEVRRIPIPGTSVNKGISKGRSIATLAPLALLRPLLKSEAATAECSQTSVPS